MLDKNCALEMQRVSLRLEGLAETILTRSDVRFSTERWRIEGEAAQFIRHEHFAFVMLGLLSKGKKTFRATTLLSTNGLGSDALVALRTLIETFCAMHYVLSPTNGPTHLIRFMVYLGRHDEKQSSKLHESLNTRGKVTTGSDTVLSDFMNRARTVLGATVVETLGKRPPFDSVETYLTLIKRRIISDGWYRSATRSAHATDVGDHITWSGDSGFELRDKPEWEKGAWVTGALVFADIITLADEVCEYGMTKSLDLLRAEAVAAVGEPNADRDSEPRAS